MSTHHAQYVLLFLVLAVNSNLFQSYVLLLQPLILMRSCMHDPHSNIDIKCTVTVTSLRGPLDKSYQKEAVMYRFLSVLRTHSVTVVYAQTVHSFISWNHVWGGDQKTISFCCCFYVFFLTACLIIKMHKAINTMCIACIEDFEGWWLSNCRSSVVKYWQLLGG